MEFGDIGMISQDISEEQLARQSPGEQAIIPYLLVKIAELDARLG